MCNNMCNRIWNVIGKIAYILLDMIFKLVKRDLTNKIYQNFMQFVKFGIVGLSNTIISYVIYVVSLLLFQQIGILINSGYLVAQVIAFLLSVLWSFYWNNKIVFSLQEGEERSVFKALIRTFISYSFTGLFLNSILLIFWVKVMHVSEFIAPIINLLVSVPLNFVINKFWAFKKNINDI
jgi:putative flippase GtrA